MDAPYPNPVQTTQEQQSGPRAVREHQMRNTSLPIALCLVALSACAAAPPTPITATAANPKDEKAILQVEQNWREALRTNNADTIAAIEDEGYTLTNSHADLRTRSDDIVEAKAHAIEYSQFYNHEQNVRLYGDTAIVTGITSVEGVSGDKPFKLDVRFTDILVRRNGEWKAVAGHVTKVEDFGK